MHTCTSACMHPRIHTFTHTYTCMQAVRTRPVGCHRCLSERFAMSTITGRDDSESFVLGRAQHLGFRILVGKVYTARDLRARCKGGSAELRRLDNFLADPTMLRPLAPPCATPRETPLHESYPVPRLNAELTTCVINLARRPDRSAHVTKVCKAFGVNPTLVDAVDGRELASRPGSTFKAVDSKGHVVSSHAGPKHSHVHV